VGSKEKAPAMPEVPEIPEAPADDMGEDPMMGGPEMPAAEEEMPEVPEVPETEGDDDSTMSIINQLSDEDRESVRAYAESMLNKSEGENEETPEVPETEDIPQMNPQEGKRFTKKQLKEEFGVKPEEDSEKRMVNKKRTDIKKGNPFNPPKFN